MNHGEPETQRQTKGRLRWLQTKARLAADPAFRERYLAKTRKRSLAFRNRHLDEVRKKQREAARRRRREHGDVVRAKARAYYADPENRERKLANHRRWCKSPQGRAWRKEYAAKNRERIKEGNRRAEVRRKMRKSTCPAYYAKRRAQSRMYRALARLMCGKRYRARMSVRLPDWSVMGGSALDVRSQWILENRSAGAAGWARERARDIGKWRAK